jgi:hypothetical protein
VAYLQIPARDVSKSAEFYEHVFGWLVEQPNPSFEAPNLIGQWVTDRAPAGDGECWRGSMSTTSRSRWRWPDRTVVKSWSSRLQTALTGSSQPFGIRRGT